MYISESLDCPALMRGSAADIHNEIHSGGFNVRAMKAASLSEDYVFADGVDGSISEATACWRGKSLSEVPRREAK